MCVIVHQPIGMHLEKDVATKLWNANSDGGGFAFVDDEGVLQVTKSMQFGSFWSQFETARSQNPGRDFLLHMRIATHGSVNLDNVHPFPVDEHTVMAHNGIIRGVVDHIQKGDDRSDTRYFVDEVLPRLPETWLDDEFLVEMVEDWIGWSKLMFITNNPKLGSRVYRLGDWTDWKGLPMTNTNGLYTTKRVTKTSAPASGWGGGWHSDAYVSTYRSEDIITKTDANVYRLPLPSGESTYQESSEDWNEWLEYKQERDEEAAAKEIEPPYLDTWEFEYLMEAIKAERAQKFLVHPLIVIDDLEAIIECSQCLETIDLETADCRCWDEVCSECWQFLALCKGTEKGGTCNFARSFYTYETLSERGKEFVNAGGLSKYEPGSTDYKLAAQAISRKEGNTSLN